MMKEHNESKLRVSKAAGPALQGSRHRQPFDYNTHCHLQSLHLRAVQFSYQKKKKLMLNLLILCRTVFVAFFLIM